MRQFVAETDDEPTLRVWLNPEDPADTIEDPSILRPGGWRIVIERLGGEGDAGIVRSTWEQTLFEALRQIEANWCGRLIWRDFATGERVDLAIDDVLRSTRDGDGQG